jgi:hypothetical protein
VLTQVINFAVFRMRKASILQLVQHLVQVRAKKKEPKECRVATKCRVEKDQLVFTTAGDTTVRYTSSGVLTQLGRLSPEVCVPALVDLLNIYDGSRLLVSRVLWKRCCTSGSEAAVFSYDRKQGCFYALTEKPLTLKPPLKSVSVVKRLKDDRGVKTKLQPSKLVQAALVEVLRKLAEGDDHA